MAKLSVVIIARDEEEIIQRCLDSVRKVADDIVVIDSMSEDRTAEISRSFGCRVFPRIFDGYGSQKQFAVDQAENDWVLSVDADEVLTPELQDEIRVLMTNPADYAGFEIPFTLFYMGRLLCHGGVGHERHLRLFNRKTGRFTTVPVHEGIIVTGKTGRLHGKIIHYSYRSISHQLQKINTYSTQGAQANLEKGRSFTRCWVMLKFPITFFTIYFLKGGIFDGYPGFMWAYTGALYSSLKVAKTIEMKKQ
jgi:glycosyltransferase involved in cell wall biosynthesis